MRTGGNASGVATGYLQAPRWGAEVHESASVQAALRLFKNQKDILLNKRSKWLVLALTTVLIAGFGLFRLWRPRPLMDQFPSSVAVYDANKHLLRLTLARDDKYRLPVSLKDIHPVVVEALLLHEDQHFYSHSGVNPVSLLRAAWQTYARRGRRAGGSTISMQLARLIDHRNTRTPIGKLRQIARALQIEVFHSKREILETYLNVAPYGRNIEGIQAASLIYLNKPAERLTLAEALTLAVIPQNPRRRASTFVVNDSLLDARMRLFRRWVAIHPEDSRDASLMTLPMAMRASGQLPFLAPHFVNRILASPHAARVYSTLDIRLQRLLERHLHAYIAEQSRTGIRNAAAMLIDYRTMEVKAEVGSAGFFDADIQGEVNGTDAKRSPGSTLKPFLYALAIDEGIIHPLTVLKDSPVSYGGFNPENFDGQFIGPIAAKDALIRSRNVPAVEVASKLTNPSFYGFLRSAGISQLQPEQHYGLGLVLGGGEVTMAELTTLYAALANEGVLKPLRSTLSTPAVPGTRILSEEAAYVTLDMLKDNPRPDRGVIEASLNDSARVCWKTGTSYGFRDAWSVGIFGPYVLAVWVGNFDGEGNPSFVGVQAAAPLFFRIVDSIRAQRGPLPGPMVRMPANLRRIDVCAVSGRLPGAHCDRRTSTWFIPGKSPIRVCEVHREVIVDNVTGLESCSPIAGGTHPEVYELWDSDMLRIFQQAGIPRRTPPPRSADCSFDGRSARGKVPQITSPTNGVTYVLRAFKTTESSIPFRAVTDADAREVFWFVNETYVGKAVSGTAFLWAATPGTFIVRAVDDLGRAGSRELKVSVAQ